MKINYHGQLWFNCPSNKNFKTLWEGFRDHKQPETIMFF